jgi:hypothetical protein
MKKNMLATFFAISALALASSGNTFKVRVAQDSTVEGKTLKAGDYKVTVENGTAVFHQGKQTVEVPARIETASDRVANTETMFKDDTKLEEIRPGGTTTRIIFDGATPASPAGQ